MPWNFRMGKKSGFYQLTDGEICVVCIHLLDSHILQSTVTLKSSGHECLLYICQRLKIQENRFFGLRFTRIENSSKHWRWVVLDRPLRKQLERFVFKGSAWKLHFGVMFHAPDISLLTCDSEARYQYYLQMKADVLEGLLPVSHERAVLLAGYLLQSECGDFDSQKHTVEYFTPKDLGRETLQLFPSLMTKSSQILIDFIRQALVNHSALRSMPSWKAQLCYIYECIALDGYGEECFSGKDDSGCICSVGYNVKGIFAKATQQQEAPWSCDWADIDAVTSKRRSVSIHCFQMGIHTFHMQDSETANYIAHLFVAQQRFYRLHSKASRPSSCSALRHGDNARDVSCSDSVLISGLTTPLRTLRLQAPSVQSLVSNSYLGCFEPPAFELLDGVIANQQQNRINQIHSRPVHSTSVQQLDNIHYVFPNVISKRFSSSQPLMVVSAGLGNASCISRRNSATSIVSPSMLQDSFNTDLRLSRIAGSNSLLNLPVGADIATLPSHTDSGVRCFSQLPAYTATPDYHSALQRPSLDEYSRRNNSLQLNSNENMLLNQPSVYDRLIAFSTPDLFAGNNSIFIPTVYTTSTGNEKLTMKDFNENFTQEKLSMMPLSLKRCYPTPSHVSIGAAVSCQSDNSQQNANKVTEVDIPPDPVSNDLTFNTAEINNILSGHQLAEEFASIPMRRMSAKIATGQHAENIKRNFRCPHVLPYENSRVKITASTNNPHGYINASFVIIKLLEKITNCIKTDYSYILTQDPLDNYMHEFWQMVIEQQIYAIVMLSTVNGNNYLPEIGKLLRYGQFEIAVESVQRPNPYEVLRNVCVQNIATGHRHVLHHFQYLGWSDFVLPSVIDFLYFMQNVHALHQEFQTSLSTTNRYPMLVHCKDGAGRSGVFVVLDILMYCVEQHLKPDVSGILLQLRQQRMHTVANLSQYRFIYCCLLTYEHWISNNT